MHKAKIDLPVLLIFFTRPDTFKKVFEKVKEARPSKLFLACDGPRPGRDDAEKIAECKKIAEDIDWECEVYTNYADANMGCGIRPQSAIGWALSIVDRIVILEDDCVPDLTFFPYMAELLEKYKDDERICMVSGLNHFKEWDCGGYSYGFAQNAAIWGWGTWARVWKTYDYTVSTVENPYIRKLLKNNITHKRASEGRLAIWSKTVKRLAEGESLSYWDSQFGYVKFSQGQLGIFPKENLIFNIGVGINSTHANIQIKDNKWKKGMLHFIPTAPMEIPLKCPEFVICDREYDNAVDNKWAHPNKFIRKAKRVVRGIKKVFKV